VVLQLLFTYAPFMHRFFASQPVPVFEGMVVVGCGVAVLLLLEAEKRVRRVILLQAGNRVGLR